MTTEYGKGFAQIGQTLEAISRIGMQAAWLWPNVDAGSDDISKGLRVFREHHNPDYLHFYRNFSPEDYVRLLDNCAVLVGNSSSGLREGAFMGVPCVNIGTRQQGREHAENVTDAGYDANEIEAAIRKQLKHGKYQRSLMFGDGTAGKQIADILATAEFRIQKMLSYVN